ncbi:MAG: ParA family protein [Candidatus Latescibacterota bacterium]|nr:MAG: ParA family protein [Candidatus Latescibacterota bacterium]
MRRADTVALLSQKGGVGKTTSAVNIGAGLAILGERVLLVDLDPQAHLTRALGITETEIDGTVYDVLRELAPLGEALVWRRLGARVQFADRDSELGVQVIPSNLRLAGAETALSMVSGKEALLRDALDPAVAEFDRILIDCPPSLGILALNALTAANRVFIPVQTEFFALESLGKLRDVIDIAKSRFNPNLELSGIIATRFDGRKILNRRVVSEVRQRFGSLLFDTVIRENIALAEAPSCGLDIFSYRSRSHGAEDYLNLCEEIIHRGRLGGEWETNGYGRALEPGVG